mmetsp:Transcript_2221/g.6562  ORF Transcript_2221/g.6562 Transcript_2221/m.6562 type:complete len:113 (+) Transcript_2221:360-698(+)
MAQWGCVWWQIKQLFTPLEEGILFLKHCRTVWALMPRPLNTPSPLSISVSSLARPGHPKASSTKHSPRRSTHTQAVTEGVMVDVGSAEGALPEVGGCEVRALASLAASPSNS